MEIKSIYQNHFQQSFEINSKLDVLSEESPCYFISCLSKDSPGIHWLSTILQRQYKIYPIFFQKRRLAISYPNVTSYMDCDLTDDTIDVEITVQTLKIIHTFGKDHSSQTSVCSPWGSHINPFWSIVKKMEAYMEERLNITNPFSSAQRYPNRLNYAML